MNSRNSITLALVSVATGIAGFGLGYKYAERQLIRAFQERLDKETLHLRRMYKPDYNTPAEMVEDLHGVVDEHLLDEAMRAMVEYTGKTPEPFAYHKIKTSSVKVGEKEEEPLKTRRIFEPDDDRGDIYMITAVENSESELGYENVTWSYFAGDGVVCDVHEDRIEDYANFLGTEFAEWFGLDPEGDDNVVYIRNQVLMIDYEICRSPGTYSQEVLEEEPPPDRPSQRISRGG